MAVKIVRIRRNRESVKKKKGGVEQAERKKEKKEGRSRKELLALAKGGSCVRGSREPGKFIASSPKTPLDGTKPGRSPCIGQGGDSAKAG